MVVNVMGNVIEGRAAAAIAQGAEVGPEHTCRYDDFGL
jgi:hypothetical protein